MSSDQLIAKLRGDEWLIWDSEKGTALVRTLETEALYAYGTALKRMAAAGKAGMGVNSADNLMFLGDFCQSLAMTRREYGEGKRRDKPTDERIHYQSLMHVVMAHLVNPGTVPAQMVVDALDELRATAHHVDDRLRGAGISGPGWHRELGRGE